MLRIVVGGDEDDEREEDGEEDDEEDDEAAVNIDCCSFRFTLSSRLDGRFRLDRVGGKIR